jgi:hypothetical protein
MLPLVHFCTLPLNCAFPCCGGPMWGYKHPLENCCDGRALSSSRHPACCPWLQRSQVHQVHSVTQHNATPTGQSALLAVGVRRVLGWVRRLVRGPAVGRPRWRLLLMLLAVQGGPRHDVRHEPHRCASMRVRYALPVQHCVAARSGRASQSELQGWACPASNA